MAVPQAYRRQLLALDFAYAGGKPVLATNILIQIDKPTQTMSVSADAECVVAGASRPDSYSPFRMEVMHYSQEWDNAGSQFLTKGTVPLITRRLQGGKSKQGQPAAHRCKLGIVDLPK